MGNGSLKPKDGTMTWEREEGSSGWVAFFHFVSALETVILEGFQFGVA